MPFCTLNSREERQDGDKSHPSLACLRQVTNASEYQLSHTANEWYNSSTLDGQGIVWFWNIQRQAGRSKPES